MAEIRLYDNKPSGQIRLYNDPVKTDQKAAQSPAPVAPKPTTRFSLSPMTPPNPLLVDFQAPQIAQASSQKVTPLTELPGGFGQTLKALRDDPLTLKGNPKKAIGDAWGVLKESVLAEGENISNLFKAPTKSGKVGAGLKTVSGAANVLFSPISALFAGAEQIPVLGSVARVINLPFAAVGDAGVGLANEIVAELPISDEAKMNIAPGLGEIFAIAGQIALGKASEGVLSRRKVGELKEKYGAKDAETIVRESLDMADQQSKKLYDDFLDRNRNFQKELLDMKKQEQIRLPTNEPLALLEAPKPSRVGTGFTFADRADRGKIEIMRSITAYQEASRKFIEKPSPRNLKRVLEAKAERDQRLRVDAIMTEPDPVRVPKRDTVGTEVPKTPKLPKVEATPAPRVAKPVDVPRARVQKLIETNKLERQGFQKAYDALKDKEPRFQLIEEILKNDEQFKAMSPEQLTAERIARVGEIYRGNVKDMPADLQSYYKDVFREEKVNANRTSGLAKSIEEKAIEQKMLERSDRELAGYEGSTIKEQARLASEWLKSDLQDIRAAIRGEKPLPDGLRSFSAIIAMEEYLKKNPNPEIMAELANSPLVSKVSQAASELGLGQKREQDSATAKLQEVRKAREAKVKDLPEKKREVVKDIKEKTKIPKEELSWNKFLDEIKC